MNIVSALIPMATTALEIATQQVSEVVHSSVSFAHLLKDHLAGSESASGSPNSVAATDATPGKGPDQTQLGEQVHREALRQRVEALRETVQRELVQRMAEQGIDLSEPAILVADRQGRLLEASGHWERAQIEQLLSDDKPLGDQVRQLLQQANAWREASGGQPETNDSDGFRLVVSENDVLLQVI